MTFLSSNGLLRCACRAEKQLLSFNTSRTSTFTSQLSAHFSSSAASHEGKPSTSSSSSSIRSTGRSTSRPERVPFVPPEQYTKATSAQSDSPITAALKQTSAGASSPSKTVSGMFGSEQHAGRKRTERRNAKEAGSKHAAEQAVAPPENAMPTTYEIHRPIKPSDSRTLAVDASGDFARQYRRLMNGVIGFNNIRTELRWEERYEKPKYKRQRLRSARHRRRFAHEVGLRVAAVLRAKSQGM